MRKWLLLGALALLGCGEADETPVPDNGANDFSAAEPAQPGEEPANTAGPADSGNEDVSACLVQDGRRIAENDIVATGTEPFWSASVEGRCVTYSTPEDLDGTRVWTEFSGSAENGTWRGALHNRPFVMRTQPRPGCSDGMSDIRYPIAVTLTVGGEQRSGCAEPRSVREKRRPT